MDKYRELLSDKLKETEGREMYSSTEVRDILLDLWLQVIEEEKVTVNS